VVPECRSHKSAYLRASSGVLIVISRVPIILVTKNIVVLRAAGTVGSTRHNTTNRLRKAVDIVHRAALVAAVINRGPQIPPIYVAGSREADMEWVGTETGMPVVSRVIC
jgi:hypothetical protein